MLVAHRKSYTREHAAVKQNRNFDIFKAVLDGKLPSKNRKELGSVVNKTREIKL